jgi:hypothetical protein
MIGTPRSIKKPSEVVDVCRARVKLGVTMRLISWAIGSFCNAVERASHCTVSPSSIRGGPWTVKSRSKG